MCMHILMYVWSQTRAARTGIRPQRPHRRPLPLWKLNGCLSRHIRLPRGSRWGKRRDEKENNQKCIKVQVSLWDKNSASSIVADVFYWIVSRNCWIRWNSHSHRNTDIKTCTHTQTNTNTQQTLAWIHINLNTHKHKYRETQRRPQRLTRTLT